MKIQGKVSGTILWGSMVAFLLFAVYLLYANQEVLYTAHERSEFLYGAPFFQTLMQKPFGLVQYVGAWLTQFFYCPMLGAGMLAALWTLTGYVGAKAFGLKGGARALMLLPVACLLTSVLDLGYWVYVFHIPGYWFSQSLGYLAMLLLLWGARRTPRRWHLVWYLAAFCLYPVLGWFALLLVLCLMLAERPSWRELLALVVLLSSAAIWRTLLYADCHPDAVMMAGFPRFLTPLDSSERVSIPFWVLGGVTALLPLCGRYLKHGLVPVACVAVGIVFTLSLMFRDRNYLTEMRMVRCASDEDWSQVVQMAEGASEPTTAMVMLKNVALMNEGDLLDRSFKTDNCFHPVCNPDSIHVGFLSVVAPLVYYHYGMMNEAIRLSFENAVQTGFSPFYLKVLSRCSMATGEEALMQRYAAQLRHHPFYARWQPAPASPLVKELQHCYADEITGVENSDSYLTSTMSYWFGTASALGSEQALFYSMMRRDPACFWPSLRKYVMLHQDEEFPLFAQEAYILFFDKAPEEKRMMLPVSEEVYDRYKQFWNELKSLSDKKFSADDMDQEIRKKWSGTYWYYYYFGRRIS